MKDYFEECLLLEAYIKQQEKENKKLKETIGTLTAEMQHLNYVDKGKDIKIDRLEKTVSDSTARINKLLNKLSQLSQQLEPNKLKTKQLIDKNLHQNNLKLRDQLLFRLSQEKAELNFNTYPPDLRAFLKEAIQL